MLAPFLTLLLAAAPSPGAPDTVPLYDNLGSHHRAIATRVPAAQAYFDQGLRLVYAFNHAEAIRAFTEAARRDSACAVCWWGVALAWGPNINLPMDSAASAAAQDALGRARRLASGAGPLERELIEALAVRYGPDPGAQPARDSAYARAMGALTAKHPADTDVLTLHADAVMNLSPWNYWTGRKPRPQTPELLGSLERALKLDSLHPGACHLFIHAVEAAFPERAVACAERLAGLMPGAGHLVHMPGHIYIRVGRYLDAIRANEHAVHADESYIRDQRPGVGVYTAGYYPHNYDFLAFAAAMAGRRAQAIGAADRLAELGAPLLGAPGMSFVQHHNTRRLQLRVRFGRWDEILAAAEPADSLLHARAMWHYARGRAFAAKGDAAAASAELTRLRALAAEPGLEGLRLEFNQSRDVLRIAELVLAGRIAAAQGRETEAIARLREAARLEDALTYGEPPDWTIPVRHELGDVLLAAGRAGEAEAVYREDLDRFPRNGWALGGLARALRAQGKAADAARVDSELREAWSTADVPLTAGESGGHAHPARDARD